MTELAESLVARDIKVTALAGRGIYNGGARLAKREIHKGIRIERAWATSFGKSSSMGRISDYLSFYIGAFWKLWRLPQHDIILTLTTPPLIGLIALIVARLRNMRVIALVQDVYPDLAVALGTLSAANPFTRLMDYFGRLILRASDRIVVLGECMREKIIPKLKSNQISKVDVIHNWADGALIAPLDRARNDFIRAHDLEEKFVVLFSGNLGRVNDFDTVLEAAKLLKDHTAIVFLFIGEGAKGAEIRRFIALHDLQNVRMLPYQSREKLSFSLAAGDVSLVTLSDNLAGLSVPSKTYGIMAAGRPILFIGDAQSDAARIVKENHCGAAIASGDALGLAKTITDWASDKAKVAAMGKAARQVFEKRFERRVAVNAYVESFSKCLAAPPAPEKPFKTIKLKETSL